jgi:hypothetical protein
MNGAYADGEGNDCLSGLCSGIQARADAPLIRLLILIMEATSSSALRDR